MSKNNKTAEQAEKKEPKMIKKTSEPSVAEKFLNNQIRYVNKVGMTPRRKIYMDMVREHVANARKEELRK